MEKKRLLYIDLMRGWAILVMIEVHVFNSMLNPQLKSEQWFSVLNFINGLVAPSFIFISGFAFMLASQYKLAEFRKFGYQFWRQLGRILLVLLVGYSLHLPFLSYKKSFVNASSPQVAGILIVDVLQCIAVSLFILFLLRLLIKSDKVYNITLSILFLSILIISPIAWQIDFSSYVPLAIADYFNQKHGSLFPLFPWFGFMAAGAICSSLYLSFKEKNNEQKFFTYLLYISCGMILIGMTIVNLELIGAKPNPFFFILRLGIILILLVFFRLYEIKRKTEKSFVINAGMESLLIYWLHLQIIYRGLFKGKSFADIINHKLSIPEAVLATLLLIILTVLIAMIWSEIKRRYKKPVSYIIPGFITFLIILFIFT